MDYADLYAEMQRQVAEALRKPAKPKKFKKDKGPKVGQTVRVFNAADDKGTSGLGADTRHLQGLPDVADRSAVLCRIGTSKAIGAFYPTKRGAKSWFGQMKKHDLNARSVVVYRNTED